ncbi:S8 family peptidase [Virgibacillus sediminis]|uniref:S8 family serine peptidase n=1 Tax=Virgibacillus sediminis TaxID=202260 RepID=A0ABV7A475_9BACI
MKTIEKKIYSAGCVLFLTLSLTIPAIGEAEKASDETFSLRDDLPGLSEKQGLSGEDSPHWIHGMEGETEIYDRRIIVREKDGSTFSTEGLGVLEIYDALPADFPYQIVRVPEAADFQEKLMEIREDEQVENAEPDYIRETYFQPEDAKYTSQWYLDQLHLPDAWDITRGSEDVVIAVLDSGVKADHPDLEGRVLPGYDFVNEDENPDDDHGHGTFVAGIIGANANPDGIAGLDHHAKILPIKIANSRGESTVSNTVSAIYYAMEQDADILNMSYGSYQLSHMEQEAIRDAYESGILLVASAGNDNTYEHSYPASYPGVISVGSTDREGYLSTFSNYGYFLDLTAPGEEIYSTFLNGYSIDNGTSFSAPLISGLAALLKSARPEWTNNQIQWALEKSAASETPGEWDPYKGYGRADAYAALTTDLPDREEAPDQRSAAQEVQAGEAVDERMDGPMDTDWFHIKVEKGSHVSILLSDPPSYLDLVLGLYDNEGLVEMADKQEMGEGEEITFTADQTKDYYIGILDYYNHWSEEKYELLIDVEKEIFSDVSHYVKEINYLAEHGIIHGFPDKTFKPKQGVTRLQAVQMILQEKGVDLEASKAPDPGFKDMPAGVYGYEAVAKAAELGIIRGKQDGTFNPSGILTRWQMAAILTAAYELEGTYEGAFRDVPEGHYAYGVVQAIAANGIARGYEDGTFKPTRNISREHFSVFLYNYLSGR